MIAFINKTWRPASYVIILVSCVVNTIFIPLKNSESVSLTDLAILIAAIGALKGLRAWEKFTGKAA